MSYESSSTVLSAAAPSCTVPAPAGVSTGKLVLIVIIANDGEVVFTPPAGFEMSDVQAITNYDSARSVAMWKVAGGSEPANYVVTLSKSVASAAIGMVFNGVLNPAAPVAFVEFSKLGDDTAPISIPDVTIPAAAIGTDLVWVAGIDTYGSGIYSNVYSAPTGFTMRTSISGANAGAAHPQTLGAATGAATSTTANVATGGSVTNPVGTAADGFAWLIALNTGAVDSTAPTVTAGPTIGNLAVSGFDVRSTWDENCTVSLLVTAPGATQPSDAAFDASTETATATAGVQVVNHHNG